jgi:hypothetical protein
MMERIVKTIWISIFNTIKKTTNFCGFPPEIQRIIIYYLFHDGFAEKNSVTHEPFFPPPLDRLYVDQRKLVNQTARYSRVCKLWKTEINMLRIKLFRSTTLSMYESKFPSNYIRLIHGSGYGYVSFEKIYHSIGNERYDVFLLLKPEREGEYKIENGPDDYNIKDFIDKYVTSPFVIVSTKMAICSKIKMKF